MCRQTTNTSRIWRIKFILFIIVLFFMQNISAFSLFKDENELIIEKVSDNVFALVGKRGPMTEKDLGTNATFGFVIHDSGVIVIDPGASYLGAERIHKKIAEVTEKPITHVINTGSEDHRWLGNGYFQKLGTDIIAAQPAVKHQKERTNDLLTRLGFLLKEQSTKDTTAVYASQTFEKTLNLEIGGQKLELSHVGPAYTPGDTLVWLPNQKILFSGDVISVERLPAIGSMSNTTQWLAVFNKIETLKPTKIIPGHGSATTYSQAVSETKIYLEDLRLGVRTLIENGGGLESVSKINQSKYKNITGFDMLSGRNAHQVFQELEWE